MRRWIRTVTVSCAVAALAASAGVSPAEAQSRKGELKIGFISALSGAGIGWGMGMLGGLELAAEDVNNAGGIKVGVVAQAAGEGGDFLIARLGAEILPRAPRELVGVAPHRVERFRAVGVPAGVTDVDEVLRGEQVDGGPGHRQAAEAAVEHADGPTLHGSEAYGPRDRAVALGPVEGGVGGRRTGTVQK